VRWLLIVVVAVLALPARAHAAGCTVTDVFYDVTAVKLDEHVTAHWAYEDGASLDTVMNGSVDWRQAGGSRADRKKKREWAFFEELSGACRVPNFRQGEIHASAPDMRYHVDGTWSAGGQTGTCSADHTAARVVLGQFTRHSTKTAPPPPYGFTKWIPSGPPVVDCPFMDEHLRRYALRYPGVESRVAKSSLLRGKVLRLPVHVRGDGHARKGELDDLWDDGSVTASLAIDGSVTLTRFSSCRFTAGTNGWRRCKPFG
jgi:hypothetical protein